MIWNIICNNEFISLFLKTNKTKHRSLVGSRDSSRDRTASFKLSCNGELKASTLETYSQN